MRNMLAARQLGELLPLRLTAGRCKYLDWSGKVQERRTCGERGAARVSYAMSPGVRRRVISALVVAVTCPVSAPAQAPLTAADSAILASQPLKRLRLAPSLLRRVSLLAGGLD